MRVALFLILSSISQFALADTGRPFDDGIKRPVLSPEERRSLLEYADTSAAKLQKALEQGKERSSRGKVNLYGKTAVDVVYTSFQNLGQSSGSEELLMRAALNSAIILAWGTPSEDARRIEKRAVLSGISPELRARIFEDSIVLALKYYEDDRRALEDAKVEVPYTAFALERLNLGRRWLSSIDESEMQYVLSIALLTHWSAIMLRPDQLDRDLFAEEITLAEEVMEHGIKAKTFQGKLRTLREKLKKIANESAKKVNASILRRPVNTQFRQVGRDVPSCAKVHGSSLRVGLQCVTSKGFVFERALDRNSGKNGWLDQASGRIWFDEVDGASDRNNTLPYESALRTCHKTNGQVLPSTGDVTLAEKHGFREVIALPDLKNAAIWATGPRSGRAKGVLHTYSSAFDTASGSWAKTKEDNADKWDAESRKWVSTKDSVEVDGLDAYSYTSFRCISSPHPELPWCGSDSFKQNPNPAVGTKCLSAAQVVFERVKDDHSGQLGWKDGSAGRIWFDDVKREGDHDGAVNHCSSRWRATLPSKEDLETAAANKFIEILPFMTKWDSAGWLNLWSATKGKDTYYILNTNALHVWTLEENIVPSYGAQALCVSKNGMNR